MCEDTHHSWKSVSLTNIQKFKYFHFEAKRSIDKEKNQIGNLSHINHDIYIIANFYKGQSFLLPRHNSNRSFDFCQCLTRKISHKTFQKSWFSNLRWSYNSNHNRRGLNWCSVHFGQVLSVKEKLIFGLIHTMHDTRKKIIAFLEIYFTSFHQCLLYDGPVFQFSPHFEY